MGFFKPSRVPVYEYEDQVVKEKNDKGEIVERSIKVRKKDSEGNYIVMKDDEGKDRSEIPKFESNFLTGLFGNEKDAFYNQPGCPMFHYAISKWRHNPWAVALPASIGIAFMLLGGIATFGGSAALGAGATGAAATATLEGGIFAGGGLFSAQGAIGGLFAGSNIFGPLGFFAGIGGTLTTVALTTAAGAAAWLGLADETKLLAKAMGSALLSVLRAPLAPILAIITLNSKPITDLVNWPAERYEKYKDVSAEKYRRPWKEKSEKLEKRIETLEDDKKKKEEPGKEEHSVESTVDVAPGSESDPGVVVSPEAKLSTDKQEAPVVQAPAPAPAPEPAVQAPAAVKAPEPLMLAAQQLQEKAAAAPVPAPANTIKRPERVRRSGLS